MFKRIFVRPDRNRLILRVAVLSVALVFLGTNLLAARTSGSIGSLAALPFEVAAEVDTVESGAPAQDKKRKKPRGKTVKAHLVPSEPAPVAEVDEAAPAAETEAVNVAPEPAPQKDPAPVVTPPTAVSSTAEPTRETVAPAKTETAAAKPAEAKVEAVKVEPAAIATRAAEPKPSVAKPTLKTATPLPAKVAPAKVAPVKVPATRVAADPPRRSVGSGPPTRPRDVVRDQVVVREVLLDVLVNDKKGNPIVGLGPEDFTVTEDGEVREVTSATYYGGGEFSGSGQDGNARTDRYFILMFHDLKQANPGLTASQLDAGRWATRWLDDGMLPNDQIAVVGYDVRLKLYQDFTRDRQQVAAAILQAARGGKDQDRWKSRSAPVFDNNSPSLFVNLPTGKTLSKATPKIQQALELLGNAAEGIAGRKNLVLFSLGFGESRGSFGHYVPDPRYYPPMEQALNNGNVAVYTINTLGVTRGGNTITGLTEALSSISTDTGGHYYSNFINVRTPLKQVAAENKGYYLISYRTEYALGEQGYQEVEIEANADGAKVRARQGYRFGDGQPTGP